MLLSRCRVAAALGLLFTAGHCYTIDEDCGGDRDLIARAANSAFALAANGLTEIQRVPINPAIDHIFQQLFGFTVATRPHRGVIEGRLGGLAAISTLDGTPTGNFAKDVRIYCTTKRIKKRKDGRYLNKDTNQVYRLGEVDNRFADCISLTPPTAALTFNPQGHPSEIQICPWFLTVNRGFKFRDLKELRAGAFTLGTLAKIVMPIASRTLYTPIDMFQVLDKVILHELTHTIQALEAQDMSDPGKPYGWKNCKDLAQIFVNNPSNFDLDPQDNSDSIALLCSIVDVITRGGSVNDDGTFAPPPTNKRRDGVMYPVTWVA